MEKVNMQPVPAHPLELLAPAGDPERLQAALLYGADAVYLAGDSYGMRAGAGNFSRQQLAQAVADAHRQGVKVYVTCNTMPRCGELAELPSYLSYLQSIGVDALIVADLGVLQLARQHAPQVALHVSTQFGVVNYATANALYQLGASRVVLARELSLQEIADIRKNTPPQLELEAFVHGAMCMSVSGRCLLSQYLTGRDANRGACAQPCRWQYRLVEETRPGQYFPVGQDESGSYILNANDLCMIEHLDALIRAGVTSLKIEGRAKAVYYVAAVTNAYRCALDAYLQEPQHYQCPSWLRQEVQNVSHRPYSTGFYMGDIPGQHLDDGLYIRQSDVVAVVQKYRSGRLYATLKNRLHRGEEVELLLPGRPPLKFVVDDLRGEDGQIIDQAVHPQMLFSLPAPAAPAGCMLRRCKA